MNTQPSQGLEYEDKFDDEINFWRLLEKLWADRWLIVSLSGLAAAISLTIAFEMPNVYQSSVLLKPRSGESGLSALASKYGGLASLAGINLPSGEGESNTALALELVKSRKFSYQFVTGNNIKPQLMAAKEWDWKKKALLLNQDDYDSQRKVWVRTVRPPRLPEPSAEEVHKFWNERFISINEDKTSGFVRISVRHISPFHAKLWLELLVGDLNETLRSLDLAEAERAISYLEGQIKQTNVAEIRELLAGLLRSHMESKMLATVETNYAFSTIDPPIVPELKIGPKRALICAFGTFLGGFLGVVIAVSRRSLLSYRFKTAQQFS